MDKLNQETPELSKIKREYPFRVPENYFDDFSARLQIRLEAEKKILPNKPNRIIQFMKPVIGIAASLALIFMMVYWPLKTFLPSETAEYVISDREVTDDDYIYFVEGIDENSFYALLGESEQSEDLTDEDLLSYLNTNVSDYELYMQTDF